MRPMPSGLNSKLVLFEELSDIGKEEGLYGYTRVVDGRPVTILASSAGPDG